MKGQDDLREWLLSQGFSVGQNSLKGQHNLCDWYAWRRSALEARRCECNDEKKGVQIVIYPYTHDFDKMPKDARDSVELRVTGKAGGLWFDMKAYSIKPEELSEKLPEIERMLVAAWNALAPREGDE